MKRGKIFNLTAGILDILFALFLFTVIVLYFVTETTFVAGIVLSFLTLLAKLGATITNLNDLNTLIYLVLGVMGIVGILSLIFGSVTVSKTRKDQKKYYRGGSVITFAIFETIGLALFVALLLQYSSLISIIIVSVFGLIVLLRYIGIGFLFCGKKKYLSETPVA